MSTTYDSYGEYWQAYLRAHSQPATRACHYLATAVGATMAVVAISEGAESLILVGIALGYCIAVSSHFLFERNRPLLNRPLWGAVSDLRMCFLAITGRLEAELTGARAADRPQPSQNT